MNDRTNTTATTTPAKARFELEGGLPIGARVRDVETGDLGSVLEHRAGVYSHVIRFDEPGAGGFRTAFVAQDGLELADGFGPEHDEPIDLVPAALGDPELPSAADSSFPRTGAERAIVTTEHLVDGRTGDVGVDSVRWTPEDAGRVNLYPHGGFVALTAQEARTLAMMLLLAADELDGQGPAVGALIAPAA